ncbi:MAG: hypothetical protein BGO21_12905 [Dyadobacter sp. 50-39]|uniref:carboxypeptidase-like regulatory domain-containing protein n=1 Tax=Dyadobacter sp. 50-39 TaxID=1895756 RepID=UPI00095EB722|nr:carboxypeptidase-like regulatory domain-containing protein [Dyadobacter sp. 50-39]OJV20258.1 MAG: hypothetical protein BGO21_12905 [Dyadobacter sp. 50-39]
MRKTLLFLFLGCLLIPGWQAFAQDKQVSGVVTADDGSVLPGVNITLKGTTRGITTDIDGKYTISAPDIRNAGILLCGLPEPEHRGGFEIDH